jgi:hypothetical protein
MSRHTPPPMKSNSDSTALRLRPCPSVRLFVPPGKPGQVTATARVTVTARADGISDTVPQIDVAQVRAADVLRRSDLTRRGGRSADGNRARLWYINVAFHTPTRPYAHVHGLRARPVNPRVRPRAQTRQELPSWLGAVPSLKVVDSVDIADHGNDVCGVSDELH